MKMIIINYVNICDHSKKGSTKGEIKNDGLDYGREIMRGLTIRNNN